MPHPVDRNCFCVNARRSKRWCHWREGARGLTEGFVAASGSRADIKFGCMDIYTRNFCTLLFKWHILVRYARIFDVYSHKYVENKCGTLLPQKCRTFCTCQRSDDEKNGKVKTKARTPDHLRIRR